MLVICVHNVISCCISIMFVWCNVMRRVAMWPLRRIFGYLLHHMKSLELIWRSGTRRWMTSLELIWRSGTRRWMKSLELIRRSGTRRWMKSLELIWRSGTHRWMKTLELIRRSGTRRFHLRVPDLLMSPSDLTENVSLVVPIMAAWGWSCFHIDI